MDLRSPLLVYLYGDCFGTILRAAEILVRYHGEKVILISDDYRSRVAEALQRHAAIAVVVSGAYVKEIERFLCDDCARPDNVVRVVYMAGPTVLMTVAHRGTPRHKDATVFALYNGESRMLENLYRHVYGGSPYMAWAPCDLDGLERGVFEDLYGHGMVIFIRVNSSEDSTRMCSIAANRGLDVVALDPEDGAERRQYAGLTKAARMR